MDYTLTRNLYSIGNSESSGNRIDIGPDFAADVAALSYTASTIMIRNNEIPSLNIVRNLQPGESAIIKVGDSVFINNEAGESICYQLNK